MTPGILRLLMLVSLLLLLSCQPPVQAELRVLSSDPGRVTGDTVLLGVPVVTGMDLASLEFRVNDRPVEPLRLRSGRDGPEVLLGGLDAGSSQITVSDGDGTILDSVDVVSHPLSGPVFSGPRQYPFVCTSELQWNRSPRVDHEEEWGFPVRDDQGELRGYSKDCGVEPFVEYHYMTLDGEYRPMPADGSRPDDLAKTELTDGRVVDFIIRWERGTLNRFLYSFATLAVPGESPREPGGELWNGRLLFQFQGGVGIGHSQGRMDNARARHAEALGRGYAVIYSTGTRTGEHYNLEVGGETALMVKEHFIKRFGQPLYTVAVGGSGGAIQQYVYARNHPQLLDGGVPQYAYPDMVTQTIHVGDCELLEHYMDVTDRDNPRWRETGNRSLLVGLNATDAVPDPLADAKRQLGYASAPGSTECLPGWRGLTPLSMNPHYGQVPEQEKMQPPRLMEEVEWTHYDDLRNIYGLDDRGRPRVPWDNVGVQYGLESVRDGAITPEEFLDVNAMVGGWKHPSEMVQEGFPFLGELTPENFDPWSRRNMNLSPDGETPAPRTAGDVEAIRNLHEHGMVFDGELTMPVIDWRHYLEHQLDMHNTHQSFAIRQRIRERMGHSDHHVVWFTDARPEPAHDQTMEALEVMHDWLMNLRDNPGAGLAATRPEAATDACFDTDGSELARGEEVWDGILDEGPPGACTSRFPTYSTSRIEAGAPITGDVFKCALKPVEQALQDGTYGDWQPDAAQRQRLQEIFPQGVCDHSRPGPGHPEH